MELNKIHIGDAWDLAKQLPDKSIHMVMTSPPYWALRDYGVPGQFGLEKTPQEYVNKLCDLFDIVKDKLMDDGSVYVNLGDTYHNPEKWTYKDGAQTISKGNPRDFKTGKKQVAGIPSKCLVQIPSRFSIEMTGRGWILRNEIIWWKRACMPASVKDRFVVDFEKVFFFTKNKKYWFEMQYEKLSQSTMRDKRMWNHDFTENRRQRDFPGGPQQGSGMLKPNQQGRSRRCVWDINPESTPDAHFATYPEKLCKIPILSSCPTGATVLDPFAGTGTTCKVAKELGRAFIGFEINSEYNKFSDRKTAQEVIKF